MKINNTLTYIFYPHEKKNMFKITTSNKNIINYERIKHKTKLSEKYWLKQNDKMRRQLLIYQ